MDYLSLCQSLQQEAGVSGRPITTVVGQTGEFKRVVDWVKNAWLEIQVKHSDWRFMWTDFQTTLTAGNCQYTLTKDPAAVFPFQRFAKQGFWGHPAGKPEERKELRYHDYQFFRRKGAGRTVSPGRPDYLTITPAGNVLFPVELEANYVLGGEYYRSPQTLTLDTDEPIMPDDYHLGIVYRALKKYATYEETNTLLVTAMDHDNTWMVALEAAQLPDILAAGSPIVE